MRCLSATIGLLLCMLVASVAGAVDYAEYERLRQRASLMSETLQSSPEESQPALREAMIGVYEELIAWLDDFAASPEYAALNETAQAAAMSDRFRWEYNVAAQLVLLERCDEASDRLSAILSTDFSDPELRPRLVSTYEEAVACAATTPGEPVQPESVSVRVESAPEGAGVVIDGFSVGFAPITIGLEPGPHSLTLQAAGFMPESRAFIAEGESMTVGPIALARVQDEEPEPVEVTRGPPEWHHYTLWGLGAGGIGTFVGLYVTARGRESTVEDPGAGLRISDPESEQDLIDKLDTIAFIAGGVGLASAIAGTILFVTRGGEPVDSNRQDVAITGRGVTIFF